MVKKLLSLIVFLTVLLVAGVDAANIYKYEDDDGNVIYDSRIPAEYVKKGYTVLNERRQVIEIVPRALTEEELAQQAQELERQRLEEEERIRQAEADRLLLRLYRSPEEVARMRDDKVEELDAQVTAINATLNKVRREQQRLQDIVATNEAGGTQPPEAIVAKLETVTKEAERLTTQIERITADKEQTISKAQGDIDRLVELLNL